MKLLLGALIFLLPLGLHAQEKEQKVDKAKLAAAHKIVDKYVKAIGGEKAIKKVKSRVTYAEMSMPAQGLTVEMTIKQKAPNKMLVSQTIPGIGSFAQSFDGKKGYAQDPIQGDRELEGKELEQMAQQSDLYRDANLKTIFPKMELLDDATIDDKKHKVIKAETATGTVETWYFDAESGLLTRSVQTIVAGPGGEMEMTTSLSDYRKVGGLLMPFKAVSKNPAMEMEVLIKDVKDNVELKNSSFNIGEPEV